MKYYLKIILLLAFTYNLSAQSFDFPKGVYMSYNELLDRKPSKGCEFTIEQRSVNEILFSGGADYKMTTSKKCLKSKKVMNDVFAYSTGNDLFINGKLITGHPWYAKVIEYGRFLLFEAGIAQFGVMNERQMGSVPYLSVNGKLAGSVNSNVTISVMFGAIGGAISGAIAGSSNGDNLNNFRFYYVIDQKENKIKTLNVRQMEFYLTNYPELLEQYKSEEFQHAQETYLKYIQLMNATEKKD